MNIRIFGILAIFLILAAIPNASAALYLKTDKTTYRQGEIVTFYLVNNGNKPETIYRSACDNVEILQLNTGNFLNTIGEPMVCIQIVIIETIQPRQKLMVDQWDQQVYVNGQWKQADKGMYKGYFGDYISNTFYLNRFTWPIR